MTTIAPNWAVTDTKQSGNYNEGRIRAIDAILIHHWGVDGQRHQDVVDFLCNANRPNRTSAHYVASAGRVTQIVSDRDTAWHCPSWNARGIGIECHPEMTSADFETVATLVAAIRSEHGHLPLSGHQDHYPTACPGRWESQLSRLSARADEILAARQAGRPVSTPKATTTTTALSDGVWGPATTRALQTVLGTPQDGVVSSQDAGREVNVPAAGAGWEWVAHPVGSQVIVALQKRLGVSADGIIGPGTITALQKRLGVTADGYAGAQTVKAMQARLSKGTL